MAGKRNDSELLRSEPSSKRRRGFPSGERSSAATRRRRRRVRTFSTVSAATTLRPRGSRASLLRTPPHAALSTDRRPRPTTGGEQRSRSGDSRSSASSRATAPPAVVVANASARSDGGDVDGDPPAGGPRLRSAAAGRVRAGDEASTAGDLPAGSRDSHRRHGLGRAAMRRSRSSSPRAIGGRSTVADELGCRTVAVPAISTGVFGYPARLRGRGRARHHSRRAGEAPADRRGALRASSDAARSVPAAPASVAQRTERRASTPGAEVRILSRASRHRGRAARHAPATRDDGGSTPPGVSSRRQ